MRHPFIRLAMAALLSATVAQAPLLVTANAQPVSADPAIGPNARADAAHAHDVLHLTPAQGTPIRRRLPAAAAGSATAPAATTPGANGNLSREVFGFAPYYELSESGNWNYNLLSTVAYFGLDVNPNGSFNESSTDGGWNGWNSQQLLTVINGAHSAGDRVVVTIKAFDDNTICAVTTSSTATQTLINGTISAVQSKNLDGVNVDFEGNNGQACPNGTSPQTAFTNFMQALSSAVHQQLPGSMLSVDTYSGSASWDSGFFKIGDLAPVVDAIFIMAYDMVFSNNSQQAGPNAPLNGWTYNDTTSVQQYLTKAPASKIILGVPYYGYKWSTVNTLPYAPIKSGSGALANGYADVVGTMGCAQQLQHSWDPVGQSPWMSWWSPKTNDPCQGNYGSWREMYYDDPTSLGLKYDLVNSNNLRGAGIWELGYQGSSPDLWRMLAARFSTGQRQFYFAEGFTGTGFTETLSLLMPNQGGTATIDYYLPGATKTQSVSLSQGQVAVVNVNSVVGPNQNVSARVTFPAPGFAQRDMHFNSGWVGSTRVIGVNSPATEWNFAEGSTLGAYSEFLTLQNPNATPVSVQLQYYTDSGQHPLKGLTLPANSRSTVIVYQGDLSNNASCTPSGTGANCGVGAGIGGVSVKVTASAPIVAERPFYVNGFNFGSGAIHDGHDAYGASAAALQWSFAEGTTIPGFNEYVTLQNPNPSPAAVQLYYVDYLGHATSKYVTVNPQSRFTAPVFQTTYGVGPNVQGVSVQVNSNVPLFAERPMYMVYNFGTGPVAGADDVVGATTMGHLFEFPSVSTRNGDNTYLTIQNLNPNPAHVTATYYTSSGPVVKTLLVAPFSRHTIVTFTSSEGAGPGYSPLPIMVDSDQGILIEAPAYSSNGSTYGAVDTMGSPIGS